ncbi:MAG: DUF1501 domain-containing protein [Acidobacteria bacterium]|nr:DUF1501 domain-containing protein [Acidobacteriota bacterium]
MKGKDKFNQFIRKHPHPHTILTGRSYLSRRAFFQLAGAGVGGYVLQGNAFSQNSGVVARGNPQLLNKAQNVIFILLTGAISHTDTFDFKQSPDTPASLAPEKISGIDWPTGIMPNLAKQVPDMAIVRSVRSWALQHNLGQAWTQIARSPAAALGDIAPNIGSVIAADKQTERRPTDTFPFFLGLNANDMIGSGYMNAKYAPVKFTPATSGFPDTNNADGSARFDKKWELLNKLDGVNRVNSPYHQDMEDFDGFYKSGRGMMFNPKVDAAFRYTAQESQRYGNSGFGNACLTASKVLASDQGTRYVQINFGSWDHHQNIYDAINLPRMAGQLDNGLSTLITDLKANGLFDKTLIVMMGEFGRTTGKLTAQGGRDHFLQQFAMFAGAGVKGGRALGATDPTGSVMNESGWYRDREVRVEDIDATIYSAMGINYTNTRYDDPFQRGLEYIPYADQDLYGPIQELWSA